ncbi:MULTISPECIES: histidine kinase dimerization/phospho-acceptor domain-containing protein [unclassified Lentimicrobium]|uniref:histidine kinase dimerization/phospho-acceptor domain-containing protein n=1 Tax=unclassified Lentimicrobium TaxID=2677434 RepID=UPI00155217EE|nr:MULTISPECIES: transporter substrate-binding domain-containing protein [unclassified Lentimicrobium]NPD46499.1 transporter substrate-binding domain-containing protein [Lentimicrobium sp. S6]NPD86005.1 transporter substrate-binding domain-containing protein [Lentimicrobium sp. L6]
MKRVLTILALLILVTWNVDAQRIVKVGAFSFHPGIFQDEDGEIKGFYVDALNEIATKENIQFVYVFGTWNEGLTRIRNGEVDLLTSVAYTEDRAEFLDYSSVPLLTVWSEVYVDPHSEIQGVLDLEGKVIAVMKSDQNGAHLKELVSKLSISCTFFETADSPSVFQLIASGDVDAGVVNNTYGAPNHRQYGLMSTGIVFNPFDIFFAVKKGENEDLINTLNTYLLKWQHDRNSIYNVARQKWAHGEIGTLVVFPEWLQQLIIFIILVILALVIFIALLRYRVKQITQKVLKSESVFKSFMDHTPAFVYIKDHDQNLVYMNDMVNNISGLKQSKNGSLLKPVFDSSVAAQIDRYEKNLLDGAMTRVDLRYPCVINEKKVWLHDFKFVLNFPDEEPSIGGISFDISKEKEIESELFEAKEKAEESDRLKSAFLANMSHEIRTPMNGILGFSELLKDPDISGEEQKEYIKVIERSGMRMLNIINDIVDISKIESGLMSLNKSKISVNASLDDIYAFFKPEADLKGLILKSCRSLKDNEVIISTDGHKLDAILANLIKNALKYTDVGQIEFGYELRGELLEFFVKDTGIGVKQDRLEAIFERFIQAEVIDVSARQGAGLGLTICKAYVEMLEGRIWAESEFGKGSAFYFSIPYSRV